MDDPLSMTRLEWLALPWVEWPLCARPFPILFIEFLSNSKKDVINLSFLMKKGGFKTITWLPKVKQRQYQTSKRIFNHYAMQTSCMKYATIKAKPVLKRGIHMLKGFIFVKLPFKFWSQSCLSSLAPQTSLFPHSLSTVLFFTPNFQLPPFFHARRIIPSPVYRLILHKVLADDRVILWESWSHWPKYLLSAR